MYLIFDTETSGLPNYHAPANHPIQPRLLQLGAVLLDQDFKELAVLNTLVHQPPNTQIHPMAFKAHGITIAQCNGQGRRAVDVYNDLCNMAEHASTIVAFNVLFDDFLIKAFCAQHGFAYPFAKHAQHCAMLAMASAMKVPGKYPGEYKWPKLMAAYEFVTGQGFDKAHDALADVRATARVWEYLATRSTAPGGAAVLRRDVPCAELPAELPSKPGLSSSTTSRFEVPQTSGALEALIESL